MLKAKHEGFVDDGYDSAVSDEPDELADTARTPSAAKRVALLKQMTISSTGNWQTSGEFDYSGGTLQSYLSDDYLKIPTGATPKGVKWMINGNIHTELDSNFDYLLNKSKGERFAAAISEYEVEGGHWFDKPVAVVIHPFTNNLSKLDQLTVQLHSERHGFIEVPRDKTVDKKGPWFEVTGSTITVYTYHFTKIICKLCDNPECSVKAVKGLVYGKMARDVNDKLYASIDVYLHFIRDIEPLPIFSEVFANEQEKAGFRLLDAKSFPPSLQQIAPTDKLIIEFSNIDAGWQVLEDSDYLKQVKCVSDYIPCLSDAYDPVCVATYLMRGSASVTINGNITLQFESQHTVKLPVSMKLDSPMTVGQVLMQDS